MQVAVYNQAGKEIAKTDAPESIFALPFNGALVYQVFTIKMGNKRGNYAHTKTRADVRGGGRKPWRQKGTGRARHGSTRSPIWVGGGVTFGPRNERNFTRKVNRKMNRRAMFVVLSAKLLGGQIFVVDSLTFPDAKTKQAALALNALSVSGRSTVVYGTNDDQNFMRTFRNIPKVRPVNIRRINIVDLLQNQYCILSKNALTYIINTYADTSTHIQKEGEGRARRGTAKEHTGKANGSSSAGKRKVARKAKATVKASKARTK